MEVKKTALMRYLKVRDDGTYFAKVLELKDRVEGWLNYVPATFPHYTRHTVGHSEEIIRCISNFLFQDGKPKTPTTRINSVEAYILTAAAYLHDAGMVCSDTEKASILASDEWKRWSQAPSVVARMSEIQALRTMANKDELQANFLADVQLRFLLAEYIRQRHHVRAADLIAESSDEFGRVSFGDPILKKTIADVCLGHGLSTHQLLDEERFPLETEIRGEKVNVRFLATVFRIGDLLDMTSERACPLLMSAASPLPVESIPHWTQYQAITMRSTSPKKIAIRAVCSTREEYQVLNDWCRWIVDEVSFASRAMRNAERHGKWSPPQAAMEDQGGGRTIRLEISKNAAFLPVRWRFELEPSAVIEHLVSNLYSHPLSYVRELLQNAIDASRVALCEEYKLSGKTIPEHLADTDPEDREKYTVVIGLKKRDWQSSSGETLEAASVLYVEDNGVGMDQGIVEKYFLQIGKSFYSSSEFRERFHFVPSSRFGVGFLSVFAAASQVEIVTRRIGSESEGIRILLQGPRSYFVVEQSARAKCGTTIEVLLNREIELRDLVQAIREWCVMVEIPVRIECDGKEVETIRAETSSKWEKVIPDVSEDGASFAVKGLPFRGGGTRGTIYLMARCSAGGERWDSYYRAHVAYPKEYPNAEPIDLPRDSVCFNGFAVREPGGYRTGYRYRVDIRNAESYPSLSRESAVQFRRKRDEVPDAVANALRAALLDHLASIEEPERVGWEYKQRLAGEFRILKFWEELPRSICYFYSGEQIIAAPRDLAKHEKFVVLRRLYSQRTSDAEMESYATQLSQKMDVPILLSYQLSMFGVPVREFLLREKSPNSAEVRNDILRILWSPKLRQVEFPLDTYSNRVAFIMEILGMPYVGIQPHRSGSEYDSVVLLNGLHPFVKWMCLALHAAEAGTDGVTKAHLAQIGDLIRTPLQYGGGHVHELRKYMARWRVNMPKVGGMDVVDLSPADFV
jgi:hypothetical protein